jgi:predicted amidophosphoribosyltransferase
MCNHTKLKDAIVEGLKPNSSLNKYFCKGCGKWVAIDVRPCDKCKKPIPRGHEHECRGLQ